MVGGGGTVRLVAIDLGEEVREEVVLLAEEERRFDEVFQAVLGAESVVQRLEVGIARVEDETAKVVWVGSELSEEVGAELCESGDLGVVGHGFLPGADHAATV